MAKKDLQLKYEEIFGVAPEDSVTVKVLQELIDAAEPKVQAEEEPVAAPKKTGRIKIGSLY
jgi:hypothetical protein